MIMDKLVQLESTHAPSTINTASSGSGAEKTKISGGSPGASSGKAPQGEGNELVTKLEAIYNNPDLDSKAKIEELYKFYLEEVLEELKNAHKQQVQLKLQDELLIYKANNVYDEQQRRAQVILNKYEVLTREYQNQNKTLKDNHERIITTEKIKRQDIITNFESHLTQIRH